MSAVVFLPLSQGQVSVIDFQDMEVVGRVKWSACRKRNGFHALRRYQGKTILLHRAIMSAPPGVQIDHCDGDGLNNRRQNLRFCDARQNQHNRRNRSPGTSKFKGVTQRESGWQAQIFFNGKKRYLGMFKNEVEAAKAYDAAARKFFGDFACPNL
jgi:hypothetical protein